MRFESVVVLDPRGELGPVGGVTDRAGRNVGSDYVGSKIEPLNDFGAGENFRLSNMSLEQNLFNKRVNILIGYYPDGNEFANSQ